LLEVFERLSGLVKLLYLDIATNKVFSKQMDLSKRLEANGTCGSR
jgi:hypothetical protein